MRRRRLPPDRRGHRAHLRSPPLGRHRALVAFPDTESVVVLLVGEHVADDPDLDVYRSLYRLLDLPEPNAKRTKPPCCREDGEPPVDADLLDRFRDAATGLSRRARRARSR